MSQEKVGYRLACSMQELQEKKVVCSQIAGKRVSVALAEGNVYAFEDSCPHQGESLSRGKLDKCIITCPAHNWKFDIRTGESTVVPDEFIYTFPVLVEEENILVKV